MDGTLNGGVVWGTIGRTLGLGLVTKAKMKPSI